MSGTYIYQDSYEGPVPLGKKTATGASLLALLLSAGLIIGGWWFVTTEVLAMRVTSGQWWFYLVAMLMLLVIDSIGIYHSSISGWRKVLVALIILALGVALAVLGVKHKPINAKNLELKLGFQPVFSDRYDGIEVREQHEDDAETMLLMEATNEKYLPYPIDQGQCGSCWAVASATALSARYARLRDQKTSALAMVQGATTSGVTGVTGVASEANVASEAALKQEVPADGWFFSPQFLLDKDERRGPEDKCSEDSFGKCNGNHQLAGFQLAKEGVVNAACVPYFANQVDDKNGCPLSKGAPMTEYLSCPENVKSIQCIQPDSHVWMTCADGKTEAVSVGESYDVRHIIGEAEMKREIANFGPILCGVNFYTKKDGARAAWTLTNKDNLWGKYSDVVTPGYVVRPEMDGDEYTKEFKEGGHAVVVYGFGTTSNGLKYWDIRNSWGPTWGKRGTLRIERGVDAWNIESMCSSAKVRDATNTTAITPNISTTPDLM